MTKTTNSAGFEVDSKKPNTVYSYGDPFPAPVLPDWETLSDDLIEAMREAHGDASYMYGDEGNGYNPHLMLAYLLQSDAFKAAFIPTPANSREVWGVQVGTWPPEKMQTEAQARWYADQPYTAVRNGQTYPVHIVKGTEYGTDWQIVETWEDGFQQ